MTTPQHALRENIRANSMNMGELGKFIRLEHVYAILDRFTVIDEHGAEQATRITAIRQILFETTSASNARAVIEQIYRVINP